MVHRLISKHRWEILLTMMHSDQLEHPAPEPEPWPPRTTPATDRARRLATAAGVAGGFVVVATAVLRMAVTGEIVIGGAFAVVGAGMIVGSLLRRPLISVALGAFVSVALVASPAVGELAFDLARWDQPAWFVWALALTSVAGCTAVQLLWSRRAAGVHPVRRSVAVGALAVGLVVGGVMLVGGRSTYRAPDGLSLPRIELTDFAFGATKFATASDGTRWATLVNDTDLPHTFTVPAVDVDVYVPAGRTATVRLPAADGRLEAHCSIGDHEALGMVATVGP
jgi:hypothetical protein